MGMAAGTGYAVVALRYVRRGIPRLRKLSHQRTPLCLVRSSLAPMSAPLRTWPYGTTRSGVVMSNLKTATNGVPVQLVRDDQREGHILTGDAIDSSATVHDKGTLTFTNGGPTGGFWKFRMGV